MKPQQIGYELKENQVGFLINMVKNNKKNTEEDMDIFTYQSNLITFWGW